MIGKVKFFNAKRGFGFIAIPDSPDVYFRDEQVLDQFRVMESDDIVSFELQTNVRGQRVALGVQRIH